MGPSFSTKREEARDGMQTLMQALGPQVAPLLADLYAKGQDFRWPTKLASVYNFCSRRRLPPPRPRAPAKAATSAAATAATNTRAAAASAGAQRQG